MIRCLPVACLTLCVCADEIGNYHYGRHHAMKVLWGGVGRMSPPDTHWFSVECADTQPHRVRMAHDLVVQYDMHKKMEIFVRSTGT